MEVKYTPSVNIIRDSEKAAHSYIPTNNSKRIVSEIEKSYQVGLRAFTLIGSYGTGKSSFLIALKNSLKNNGPFDISILDSKKINFIEMVGQYQSITSYFQEYFNVEDDFEGSQKVFDQLFVRAKKSSLTVIFIDEFGKFLEYASKHNPEKELYFLQNLAEFVSSPKINILLVTTLHQNFETYGLKLSEKSQRTEWKKVKGRYKELTFNEPVEQLIEIAADFIDNNEEHSFQFVSLLKEKNLFVGNFANSKELEKKLYPLDLISASALTYAIQKYGQNERSLFSFLEEDLEKNKWFSLIDVYNYIYNSYYSFVNSAYNPHYKNWQAINNALERVEALNLSNLDACKAILKTIGVLQIFSSKGSIIDNNFIITYLSNYHFTKGELEKSLFELENKKVIRYAKYDSSFKLIEGTDVDFDFELNKAEDSIDKNFHLIELLKEHFKFPVIEAKRITYKKGTPRFFSFIVSDTPEVKKKPVGQIDGYINLVFNNKLNLNEVIEASKANPYSYVYGYFTNTQKIRSRVFEILKTKKVLAEYRDDFVAKNEFENILNSHERLLTHEVIDSLYSGKVKWFHRGNELTDISNQKALNSALSGICETDYPKTPIFHNELLNKHKISSSIHTARKNLFKHLTENWDKKDLGFVENKFPPEKTIYLSLISSNGIHQLVEGKWELGKPNSRNGFDMVYNACEEFLFSARDKRKPLSEFWNILKAKPFKLKQGLIDFWVPIYLFTKRGDFALYEDDKFIPELNDSILYLIARQPHKYTLKAFEISGLRLQVFNKYRNFLAQDSIEVLEQNAFIESVKPFLIFYKSLNEYSRNTSRLSNEAIELRKAIENAKDPETVFFESIPNALKVDLSKINSSDKQLVQFANKLHDAVDELKNAYNNLLNRFEEFICDEIFAERLDFEKYKNRLAKRFSKIKSHHLLPKQKVLIDRLNSPINDRDSWLSSIGQAVLGKPLYKINDEEELVLKDSFLKSINELDNLLEVQNIKVKETQIALKVDLTGVSTSKTQNVIIEKKKLDEFELRLNEMKTLLGKNKKQRLEFLSFLLNKELENE